jgi:capsular exopolysaccharide synthesis family protein
MIQESLIEGIFRSLRKHAGWATIIVGLAVIASVFINRYFPAVYESQALLRVMTSENASEYNIADSMNGVFSQKNVLAELANECGLSAEEAINTDIVSFKDGGAGIVKLFIRHNNPSSLDDISKAAIKILSERFLLFSSEKRDFAIKVAQKKIEQLENTLNEARAGMAKVSVDASFKVDDLTMQLENEMHQLEEKIDLNGKKLQTMSSTIFYYVEEENAAYRKYSKDLNQARNELAELFKDYKEKHPKVVSCQTQIKELEKKLKSSRTRKKKEKANPRYVALTSEIEGDKEKLQLVRGELQRIKASLKSNENKSDYLVSNLNLRIRALEELHKQALLNLEETRLSQTSTQGKISVLQNDATQPKALGFSAVQRDCIAVFSGVLLAIFLLYSPAPVRTEIVSVSGDALAGAITPNHYPMLTAEPAEIILQVPSLTSEPLALPAPQAYSDTFLHDERLIALNDPESEALVPYKSLVANLQINISESSTRIVLIGSARASSGRTTLLANTAILLAQAGYSVLMLDANFRKPVLHRVFDLENNPGFSESLRSGLKSSYIQKTNVKNLFLLPCGIAPQNPAELLGSPEMIEVLSELKRRVEVILIDTAALLEHPDTGIMAGQAGAMVFMYRKEDSEDDLKAAKKLLKSIRARVFGYVKT